MNDKHVNLEALIDEYVTCAETALEDLSAHFGVDHCFTRGGGVRFQVKERCQRTAASCFTDSAASLDMGTTIVDVEIGMQGQVAGFEPSQLLRFAGPRLQMT